MVLDLFAFLVLKADLKAVRGTHPTKRLYKQKTRTHPIHPTTH